MLQTPAYGKTRTRAADVSYGQIEAAAQEMLVTGVRPTVDGIRAALKSGSQRTLLNGLQRFWKELGERIAGIPDSRRRLPAAVAELADSFWQTALTLSMDAADGADSTLRNELRQLRREVETRGHALAQREVELDGLVRSRERTIRELEDHLRTVMGLVAMRDATVRSLETRLAGALLETDDYRQRLAQIVEQTVKPRPIRARKSPSRRPSQGRVAARPKAPASKSTAMLKRRTSPSGSRKRR